MKRILIAISIFFGLSQTPLAAETVEGYLIDVKCAANAVKEGVEAAKAHTKECALMPDCKASGYGVVTDDGRFYEFVEQQRRRDQGRRERHGDRRIHQGHRDPVHLSSTQ